MKNPVTELHNQHNDGPIKYTNIKTGVTIIGRIEVIGDKIYLTPALDKNNNIEIVYKDYTYEIMSKTELYPNL